MAVVLTTVVSGILLGLMYGLTGMGLTFTMGFGKTMNVAQGTLIILGAFFALTFFNAWHLNVIVLVILVMVLFGVLAGLLNLSLLRFLRDKSEIITLLVLFGVAEVIENVTSWIWTGNLQAMTIPTLQNSIQWGSLSLPKTDLVSAAIAVVATGVLYLFLQYTYLGKAIRASAQSDLYARILGVNTSQIRAIIFLIGLVLAGIAGVTVALLFPFAPQDQDQWLVMAFIVVVVGGIDNILSTLLAGLVIGVAQALAGLVVPFQDQNLILYAFLAIALLFRNNQLARRMRSL
ncbi:MAG: branched-chain amino acid ABC transporter permease [Firmicutes bacterium]|nr:branched-chain amino acid ABC transporter permease [Bacillota bacterium]